MLTSSSSRESLNIIVELKLDQQSRFSSTKTPAYLWNLYQISFGDAVTVSEAYSNIFVIRSDPA